MTQLTLEIPDRLARALRSIQVDERLACQIALEALEICVERGLAPPPESSANGAAAFAQRLIDDNRALFEELAGR